MLSITRMATVTRVLVVEDELKITRLVRDYLTEAGFNVITAATGPAAVALERSERPDLLILDVGLPGMDGLDVARSIRTRSQTPIIMLTARSEETDRIVGLEIGADDYVVKPFSPRELVARVKAVLRRAGGEVTTEMLRVGDVEIDPSTRTVVAGGRAVTLTATEFEVLVLLAHQPGRVFTRGQVMTAIRGSSTESMQRVVDTHIKNMRKKLEPDPANPRYLLTVHGVGYKFTDA